MPGSLLSELFAGVAAGEEAGVPRDADGSYFIDRDGPSFRHVLNYLRAPAGAEPGSLFVCARSELVALVWRGLYKRTAQFVVRRVPLLAR